MQIGPRIRKLRQSQRRTLQQIADACGFTKSLLSKIENGRTMPPVATLTKIAAALGVDTSALLDGESSPSTVLATASDVRRAEKIVTDRGYSFFAFAAGRPGKEMQPFLFEVKKGEVKPQALHHEGEEFVYMLEGKVKYRVGEVEHRLEPGDSLYFDAAIEHEVTPVSPVARYLGVFSQPSMPERK